MEDKNSILKLLNSGNLSEDALKKVTEYVKNSDATMDHQEPVMDLQKQLWAEGETKGWTKEQTMREINDALGESIHYAEKQIKDLSTENSELRDSIREFRQQNINDYVEDLYERQVMVNDVYDKGELLDYIEKLDAGDEPLSGPLLGFLGRIDNFTEPEDYKEHKAKQMGEDEDDENVDKYMKDKASKKVKMDKNGQPVSMADYLENLTDAETKEVVEYMEKKRLLRSMDMNEQTDEDFEKDFEEDFGSHKDEEKVATMEEHGDDDKEKVMVKVKVKSDKDSDKDEDKEDKTKDKMTKADTDKKKDGEDVDMEYTQTSDNEIGQDDNVPTETTDMHEQALSLIKDNPTMDYVEALKSVVSQNLN